MNKRRIYIFSILFVLTLLSVENAYSQLLEDRNKLKTARRERKGFTPFSNNVKKSAKAKKKPQVIRALPTRNTLDIAGKGSDRKIIPRFTPSGSNRSKKSQKTRFTPSRNQSGSSENVNPRFSSARDRVGSNKDLNPRFSTPRDRVGSSKGLSPRFSTPRDQMGSSKGVNPRFSPARGSFAKYARNKSGKYRKVKGNPRFSTARYLVGSDHKEGPRFTIDIAGQGYDRTKINPRFTVRDNKRGPYIQPRYSKPPAYVDNPASGQKKSFLPAIQLFPKKARYTQSKASKSYGPALGKKKIFIPIPLPIAFLFPAQGRHKQGKAPNFYGPKVKAIYSPSNSMASHNKTLKSYQKYIAKGGKKSPYSEQTSHVSKMKKLKKAKHSHPSANYLTAKYNGSPLVRETKRKFNVTWVRMFGNKTQPKGVKKTPGKSKFDKDEKDIWNNKEREYTRN